MSCGKRPAARDADVGALWDNGGMSATLNEILDDLEDAGQLRDEDALYEAFVSWAEGTGRPLYPHQEEALVEILAATT